MQISSELELSESESGTEPNMCLTVWSSYEIVRLLIKGARFESLLVSGASTTTSLCAKTQVAVAQGEL